MSDLLSNILRIFEPLTTKSDKQDLWWQKCFIEPSPPDYALFRLMIYISLICVISCFLQVINLHN